MEHERGMLGALRRVGMRVAELRRPGEVEQVVVEVPCGRGLGSGRLGGKRRGAGTRDRFGYGLGLWITSRQGKKKAEEDDNGSLLHGGSISGKVENSRIRLAHSVLRPGSTISMLIGTR